MKRSTTPRWAVSLADLTLLLLGFTVMLNVAMERKGMSLTKAAAAKPAVAAPAPAAAPALFAEVAEPLFADGEARLTPHARGRLNEIGHQAAGKPGMVRVYSSGSADAGARFDRWELTAARAAAVARALAEGGLPQDRIDLVLPSLAGKQGGDAQKIVIRHN